MKTAAKEVVPKFVKFIPKELEEGMIYVSGEYATTVHKCACGCGEKVVLPLHPTDWWLKFDGESITMRPSVGNWGFPCRSHYLITANRIEWAGNWTDAQIAAGRDRDVRRKTSWNDQTHFKTPQRPQENEYGKNRLAPVLRAFLRFLRR